MLEQQLSACHVWVPEELELAGEPPSPRAAQIDESARRIGLGSRHTPQTAPEKSALTKSLSPASGCCVLCTCCTVNAMAAKGQTAIF